MGDPSDDVGAFVLNSKYRTRVLEHLGTAERATPTQLAADSDARRSHISRALSELRDRGVVELRVSEETNVGRYYGLTETGQRLWERLRGEIRDVRWSHADPETAATEALVALAEDELGDDLRFVGTCDGDRIRFLHAADDALADYTDEQFERGLRALVFDDSLSTISFPTCELRADVAQFDAFTLLRVQVDDRQISVSFEPSRDVPFPSFAERIAAVFDDADTPDT